MRPRLTRRAALAAAAGAALARPAVARAGASEAATVRTLIAREDAATQAYEHAAAETGDPLLGLISRQDHQHGDVLRVQLEALTVPAPHRPGDAVTGDPAAARLARARTRSAALAAAVALEHALADAYADATRALAAPGLLGTVTSILAAHAQQLAALRDAAGRPPLDEPALGPR